MGSPVDCHLELKPQEHRQRPALPGSIAHGRHGAMNVSLHLGDFPPPQIPHAFPLCLTPLINLFLHINSICLLLVWVTRASAMVFCH